MADFIIRWILFKLVFALDAQFSHRQEFKDALFDILQSVMIVIEHLTSMGDIEVVIGFDCPGQGDQPIQVGTDDAVFGCGSGQAGEPVEFSFCLFVDLFWHASLIYLPRKLVDIGGLFIGFPQLFLNGFELFAQEIFPLHFVDFRASFVLNL